MGMRTAGKNRPTTTVTSGAIAGAGTVVVLWILKDLAGMDAGVEVAGAMQMVLTFIVQHLVENRDG